MGFLDQNAMKRYSGEQEDIIVDLGYIMDAETTIERAEKLREYGIGKKNFSIELYGRMVMKCPPTRLAGIMKAFPIVEGGGYWMTTHRWDDDALRGGTTGAV